MLHGISFSKLVAPTLFFTYCLFFSLFSLLEIGRGHTIKQLPQASPDLCTSLIRSTAILWKATGLFSKTTQREVQSKKTNKNDGFYWRIFFMHRI